MEFTMINDEVEDALKNKQVIIVLGSKSDKALLHESKMTEVLDEMGVKYIVVVISAHRNVWELQEFCRKAAEINPYSVFIAAAGMSAALPGAIAAIVKTRPVIGVALPSEIFNEGTDALFSIVQTPSDIPLVCAGIGKAGFKKAALFACLLLPAAVGKERIMKYNVEHRKNAEILIISP